MEQTPKTTRKRSLEAVPNAATGGAIEAVDASAPERKAAGKPMTPKELQALFMRGAQAGAETLVGLLEEGLASDKITPRELAIVTGIMVDKVAKLAPLAKRDDDDVMTPEELERELKRQHALAEELKRREDLEAAGKATPCEEVRDESPPIAPVASPARPVEVRSHRLFGNASR